MGETHLLLIKPQVIVLVLEVEEEDSMGESEIDLTKLM